MKTLVTFEDVTFIENEEKRTVVCIMRCKIQKHKHPIYNRVFIENVFADTHPWAKEYSSCIYYTVVGKSKCHDNDNFNVSLGRKIAESRAKEKAFDRASQYWDFMYENLYRILNACKVQYDYCYSASIKEEDHVLDLIYDNNN